MKTVLSNKAEPLETASRARGDLLLLVVDPCRCDYEQIEQVCPSTQQSSAQVFFADSLSAAVHLLRQTSFDLCVVNLSLQNQDGPSLLWRIQSAQPGMPIVAVADHYDSHLEQAAWRLGATAFVAKPEHQLWLDCWLEEHSLKRQRTRFFSEFHPENRENRPTERLIPI